MAGSIRVGTSGFSYAEWKGPFYPKGLPPQGMLLYYARHFPAVELNATFYRIPSPRNMESLVNRAGPGFEFAVKAHQDITHSREGLANALPAFRDAIRPLAEAGALACVLVQFPYSFRHTPANREHILRIKEGLPETPLVVEFRHRSWLQDPVFDLLRREALGFCCVDEPRLPGLLPPRAIATAPIGYVRFHGRNAAKWWHHGEAWERYDYLYSEAELRDWIPRIRGLAGITRQSYIFFNNHAGGQAVTNAQMLTRLLSEVSPSTRPVGEARFPA